MRFWNRSTSLSLCALLTACGSGAPERKPPSASGATPARASVSDAEDEEAAEGAESEADRARTRRSKNSGEKESSKSEAPSERNAKAASGNADMERSATTARSEGEGAAAAEPDAATDTAETDAPEAAETEAKAETSAAAAPMPDVKELLVVYELRHPTADHLYSPDPKEAVTLGFLNEGWAWRTLKKSAPGTQPLYRCFNQKYHYVTLDKSCPGFEGAFFDYDLGHAYKTAMPGTKKLVGCVMTSGKDARAEIDGSCEGAGTESSVELGWVYE